MQHQNDDTDIHTHAFKSGNVSSFNYFFDKHYTAICYFTHRLVKDQAVAEEITADAFIKLWERYTSFYDGNAIKAFLYTAVRNASLSYLRKCKTQATLVNSLHYLADKTTPGIQHDIIRAETMNMIYQSLHILPKKCLQVFELFYLENKSYEEIAAELKLSVNNVRNHKMRGLNLLKSKLGNSLLSAGIAVVTAGAFILGNNGVLHLL